MLMCAVTPELRSGNVAVHGQTYALGPAEAAMVKTSWFHRGSMRVGVLLQVVGPAVSDLLLQRAVADLAALHPVLRCCLQRAHARSGAVSVTNPLVLRVDDTLRVPVHRHAPPAATDAAVQAVEAASAVHSDGGAAASSVTAAVAALAWQHMWALIEKRPLQLDQPLAAIDVMAVRDVTVLVLSCEHAFCDGISLSTAAHALLAFMAAAHERTSGSVGTDAPVEITARVWGPPCEVAALAKFETRELDARMDGLSAFTRPEDVDVIPTDQPQLNGMGLSAICSTRVGVHTLSVSQSTALIQACRARGTTVSAVLGAAFMHALADTVAGAAGSAACLAPTPADEADGTSLNATSRALTISLSCAADTRRLYRPPLDSTCLAYHASGLAPFPAQLIPGHDAAAGVWTLSGQVCVASGCVLGARCGGLGDGSAALFRDQFYLLFVDVLFGAWSWPQLRSHISACLAVSFPLSLLAFVGKAMAAQIPEDAPPLQSSAASGLLSSWGVSPLLASYVRNRFVVWFV